MERRNNQDEIWDTREFWKLFSYVKISEIRRHMLIELSKTSLFPSELARRLDRPFSTVSKYLRNLVAKGILVCRTPDTTKGRLYSATRLGKRIVALLNQKSN